MAAHEAPSGQRIGAADPPASRIVGHVAASRLDDGVELRRQKVFQQGLHRRYVDLPVAAGRIRRVQRLEIWLAVRRDLIGIVFVPGRR